MISWVGIDISKATLAIWIRSEGVDFQMPNVPEATRPCLSVWLTGPYDGSFWRPPVVRAGGDGPVWRRLTMRRYASIPVSPELLPLPWAKWPKPNPSTVPCCSHDPGIEGPVSKVPTSQQQLLRELVQRRDQLVQQRDDKRWCLAQALRLLSREQGSARRLCSQGVSILVRIVYVWLESSGIEPVARQIRTRGIEERVFEGGGPARVVFCI